MPEYEVTILYEKKRGCGYRKAGKTGMGIYLMGDLFAESCERLPFGLAPCKECTRRGLRCQMTFSRAPTWIGPEKLFTPELEPRCHPSDLLKPVSAATLPHRHGQCPMCSPPKKGLLIWIGRGHYSISSFNREAAEMGISRKLTSIPRGFEIGKHWVYLAHVHAIVNFGEKPSAGVFWVFRPSHIDLVIDDENSIPEKAKHLKDKYGDRVRLVKVIPKPEPEQLPLEEEKNEVDRD